MSWLFSRALVEEYSEATCSDGGQSAPLNASHMPHLYLHSDRMTAFSRLSRFGMTFGHSTAESGAALLTWFRGDFLARTSAAPEPVPESPESGQGSGEKWHGSLARYDRASSTWKTHQYSLLGDLTLYSETWPRWGLMRDGVCWGQSTLAPRTSGTESGLWPTLTASIGTKCGGRHKGRPDTLSSYLAEIEGLKTSSTSLVNPVWAEWFMGWPLGWTDLKPLAMDKYRQWLQWHGEC